MNDPSPNGNAFGFPTSAHPAAAEKVRDTAPAQPDEQTLDAGLEESFPASDPVSVSVSAPPRKAQGRQGDPSGERGRARSFWRQPAPVALVSSALLGAGALTYWAATALRRRRSPRRITRLWA